jgi:hypothetical protein
MSTGPDAGGIGRSAEPAHHESFSWRAEDTINIGREALKALLLLNGGASVAFLTFLGTSIEKSTISATSAWYFTNAMQFFIWGTAAAVGAFIATFANSVFFHYRRYHRAARISFRVSLWVAAMSLGLFMFASYQAIEGFRVSDGAIFQGREAPQ